MEKKKREILASLGLVSIHTCFLGGIPGHAGGQGYEQPPPQPTDSIVVKFKL